MEHFQHIWNNKIPFILATQMVKVEKKEIQRSCDSRALKRNSFSFVLQEQLFHRHATFTFNQNIAAAQLHHQQKRLADLLLYLSHFLFLSHIGRRPDLARYPDNKAEARFVRILVFFAWKFEIHCRTFKIKAFSLESSFHLRCSFIESLCSWKQS